MEEAIYWGLPVIVSDHVGCSIDMVQELNTGLIFRSNDIASLHAAVVEMETRYDEFCQAVNHVDWVSREKRQIAAYTSLLN